MSGKRRLFVTTLSDAARGLAEEIYPNIATCYHFTGLFYGVEKTVDSRKQFDNDVARLAQIVNEEGSRILVLGAHFPDVPRTSFDIAEYLFKRSKVDIVIAIATQPLNQYEMRMQLLGITARSFSVIFSSPRVHRQDYWHTVITEARKVYENLPASDRTP